MRFQKIRVQAVELSSQRRPWAIIFMETRSCVIWGCHGVPEDNTDGQTTSVLLLSYTCGKSWPFTSFQTWANFQKIQNQPVERKAGSPCGGLCTAIPSVHRNDSSSPSQSNRAIHLSNCTPGKGKYTYDFSQLLGTWYGLALTLRDPKYHRRGH